MPVKINTFEAENVKRIKAVQLEPTQDGLTVIGGKNKQGKTSVLDSIAWALGGDRKKPDNPHRDGSVLPPSLKVTLSNGIRVERAGANSSLKVIDPEGNKAGQTLLNSFIEELALDLPKFMEMTDKEKAHTLLKIIGVGDELYELERQEELLYNERLSIGRIKDQKAGAAAEMEYHSEAPDEPISASELIQEQQAILQKNAENQAKRDGLKKLQDTQARLREQIDELTKKLRELNGELDSVNSDIQTAMKTVKQLEDESTVEIEESIARIDETNRLVRINQAKRIAEAEAEALGEEYRELTEDIETLREKKIALLDGAELPLPGLGVEDMKLTYEGLTWDSMSGSEQLKVATAIVQAINPEMGFVLVDKLEQMDLDTLEEFGMWAEEQGLQVIATRVTTGDEATILIHDGYSIDPDDEPKKPAKTIGGAF